MDNRQGFGSLVRIMDRLREPGGCPWDREQTYETLRGYLIEECYEAAAALDAGNPAELCEELGDLLFQIVFLSRLAKEEQHFTVDDVIEGISRKMIRRHPHVFGSETAETSAEVLRNWEEIKRREKGGDGGGPRSAIDGIPAALPALLKAQRLGSKAARVGFDWERPRDVLEKVEEELDELRRAVDDDDRDAARAELGDLLFSLVMLARRLEIDPEGALERTNLKFSRRFREVESLLASRGKEIRSTPMDELEALWQRAKQRD